MQELMGTARNLSIVVINDKPSVTIEVILMTSEPKFAIDAGGMLGKSREANSIRFTATPESLRDLCKRLAEYAKQGDELVERVEVAAGEPLDDCH